jgi:hypothetical protein
VDSEVADELGKGEPLIGIDPLAQALEQLGFDLGVTGVGELETIEQRLQRARVLPCREEVTHSGDRAADRVVCGFHLPHAIRKIGKVIDDEREQTLLFASEVKEQLLAKIVETRLRGDRLVAGEPRTDIEDLTVDVLVIVRELLESVLDGH